MKLTSLTIARMHSWDKSSPVRAVVKIDNETSSIECVLSDQTMQRLLDVCMAEVAADADRSMREFVSKVNAIETAKSLILSSEVTQ